MGHSGRSVAETRNPGVFESRGIPAFAEMTETNLNFECRKLEVKDQGVYCQENGMIFV
jgi:hypothetical protein